MVASACPPLSLPTWMSLETFAALVVRQLWYVAPGTSSHLCLPLCSTFQNASTGDQSPQRCSLGRPRAERLGCSRGWVCPSHVGGENRAAVQAWPPSLWSSLCIRLSPGSAECGLSTLDFRASGPRSGLRCHLSTLGTFLPYQLVVLRRCNLGVVCRSCSG